MTKQKPKIKLLTPGQKISLVISTLLSVGMTYMCYTETGVVTSIVVGMYLFECLCKDFLHKAKKSLNENIKREYLL